MKIRHQKNGNRKLLEAKLNGKCLLEDSDED